MKQNNNKTKLNLRYTANPGLAFLPLNFGKKLEYKMSQWTLYLLYLFLVVGTCGTA